MSSLLILTNCNKMFLHQLFYCYFYISWLLDVCTYIKYILLNTTFAIWLNLDLLELLGLVVVGQAYFVNCAKYWLDKWFLSPSCVEICVWPGKRFCHGFNHLGVINNNFLVFEVIFAQWQTNTHQKIKLVFLMISQHVMAKLLIKVWLKKCDKKFCPRLLLNILRALD